MGSDPAKCNKANPDYYHRQEVEPSVKCHRGAAHGPEETADAHADEESTYSRPEGPEGLLCALECQDHCSIRDAEQ